MAAVAYLSQQAPSSLATLCINANIDHRSTGTERRKETWIQWHEIDEDEETKENIASHSGIAIQVILGLLKEKHKSLTKFIFLADFVSK